MLTVVYKYQENDIIFLLIKGIAPETKYDGRYVVGTINIDNSNNPWLSTATVGQIIEPLIEDFNSYYRTFNQCFNPPHGDDDWTDIACKVIKEYEATSKLEIPEVDVIKHRFAAIMDEID